MLLIPPPCCSTAFITPLPAPEDLSGIPEVGYENGPPESPPLTAYAVSQTRRGAAAHYIRSECERFCCETLRAIFLGEGHMAYQHSLAMNARNTGATSRLDKINGGYLSNTTHNPDGSMDSLLPPVLATSFFELWDYVKGNRFKGFVAQRDGKRGMFVFFDHRAFGLDMKPGLLALIELCNEEEIDCSELVICVDRQLKNSDSRSFMKSFSWVGFEPATLAEWTDSPDIVSERWIFLSMEV